MFLWWCGGVFVVVRLRFCGMVAFLWCGCGFVFLWRCGCFCGGIYVVVWLRFCGVVVLLCLCGGAVVFLWWCGGVFAVVFL